MNSRVLNRLPLRSMSLWLVGLLLAAAAVTAVAQDRDAASAPLSASELDNLVAPVALYPDDLLAIVLPAATYPLQLVEAQRFLDDGANAENATPDPAWDDAIVALLNYPEALALLNEDLDWTWQLGEAVLGQQTEVLEAVERFRDQAYLAGNLETDDRQIITRAADRVVIAPAAPEVIYVPYYDPVEVVVRRPYRTYFYHDVGYPLYYHPYAVGHRFYGDPFFWGVSTAFAISWHNRFLNLNYFDTVRHPFYGFRVNSRRFFRHRHSRDYFVYGGTGRFNRRGHYRWFPNRFHGSRPGYSRNRTAGRQLTYNRNGYTRAQPGTVRNNRSNRSRFAGNSRRNASDSARRQNTNRASGQRFASGNRQANASNNRATRTQNRANSRFTSRSDRTNARATNRSTRTTQRANTRNNRAQNRTTKRGGESRATGAPVKQYSSGSRSQSSSRFTSGRGTTSRATANRSSRSGTANRSTRTRSASPNTARRSSAPQRTQRAASPSRQASSSRASGSRSGASSNSRMSSSRGSARSSRASSSRRSSGSSRSSGRSRSRN